LRVEHPCETLAGLLPVRFREAEAAGFFEETVKVAVSLALAAAGV